LSRLLDIIRCVKAIAHYTRSQAVDRIADRRPTASQHLWGHVMSSVICHFLLVVLWNQASISNGFRYIQRRVTQWLT